MPKTMTEALAELRDDIDEQTAHHWLDPQLIRYMNDGIRKVATLSECLRATTTKAIVAETGEYTMSGLTNDIIRFHAAFFTRTGDTTEYPLTYRDLLNGVNDWGSERTRHLGTPQYFYTWDAPPTLKVNLYPIPSDDGTLTLWYYRLPAQYNTNGSGNSAAIDLPAGWESCAVYYAKYRAYKFDGQMEQAQMELAEFQDTLKALSAAATRFTDQPGGMSMVGQAGLPHWLVDDTGDW